jgi:hypothetical protein
VTVVAFQDKANSVCQTVFRETQQAGVNPIRRVPFDRKKSRGRDAGTPRRASEPVLGVWAGAVTTTCLLVRLALGRPV